MEDLKKFTKSDMAMLFLGVLQSIDIPMERKEHLNFIFDIWQFQYN